MAAAKKAGRREGVWEEGGFSVSRRMRDSGREVLAVGCVFYGGKWREVLWTVGVVSLVVLGFAGATCEVISAAIVLRLLPRALMKMSARAGFFIVAKETKTILARSSC